jgi:uncharacterized damage-inducible protein DinB
MLDTSLARAVEQFVRVTQGLPDPELDREWAWRAYDAEGVRFAFFRTYEELRELAAKIATERHARGALASTAQRILAQYHLAYRDLQAALLGVGQEALEQVPAEGEWSLRQTVAHAVAAEVGFFVAVRYALDRQRAGDGRPAKIPEEAWGSILGEDAESLEALLGGPSEGVRSYHEALHARVLREFAGISEEELEAPSTYWEGYEMSLRFRLHRFDSHLRQHTIQVDKTLARIGHPPSEAQRLLRLICAALAEAEGATIGAWDVGAELRNEVAEAIAARVEEIAGILKMPLSRLNFQMPPSGAQ